MILIMSSSAWAQSKLPGGVTFRLKEVDRLLVKGGKGFDSPTASAEWKVATAREAVKGAREKMKEIEEKFAGQFPADHPDLVAAKGRIDALEARANGAAGDAQQAQAAARQGAAAAQDASGTWTARLKPFVTGAGQPGYEASKYLIPSATQEEADMARRLEIFAAASAAMDEYRKANLGDKRTDELRDIEQNLEAALKDFQKSCLSYSANDLAEAETKLNQAETFIKAQETKSEARQPFVLLQKDQLMAIQSILDRAAGITRKDEPKLAALQGRVRDLGVRDGKLRAARVADTRMRPEAYKGKDLPEIRKAAQQVIARAHPDVKVLKTSVAGAEWRESNVVEWTDTTQTALRHRVTRSVTVEVAGKKGPDAFLYTLDINSDRTSSGSWGPLGGHVMFIDRILEQNVK